MSKYFDMEDEKEAKRSLERNMATNSNDWIEKNAAGDTEGANLAHERQKKEVDEWDAYTGGKSTYDAGTGKWNLSEKENSGAFRVSASEAGGEDKVANNHMKHREAKRGEESYRTREFEYDLESDPLWQQYISSARKNGERAMTDTLAKASAQTGGIAGSYAVSAGAGAYNDYMQGANDIIPELQQIAYAKYQDELARDLKIYEMDEREKDENARVNAVAQNFQYYGDDLTKEDREAWYRSGGWIEGDTLVDSKGNRYNRGAKSAEEKHHNAYEKYRSKGWKNLSEEDKAILRENGYYYDSEMDMITNGNKYYTWNGSISTDGVVAKYKSGEVLTTDEIKVAEKSGYTYKNGVLYKDGKKLDRDYMLYDEVQAAYNDYNNNGWKNMSDGNKLILQENGYSYDDRTDMVKGKDGYYRWGGTSPVDIAIAKYKVGESLTEDEVLLLNNGGYDFKGEVLYYNGIAV